MKKVSLNGWQRLWVVLTVLSLLLIAVAVWFRWPAFENSRNYSLYYDSLSSGVRSELIRPGTREDKDEFIEFYGEMPNGDRLRFKKGIKQEKADTIAQEYTAIVWGHVHKERKRLLMTAGAVWLGGAFAVYAFGWAVVWVYRGFRPIGKGGG